MRFFAFLSLISSVVVLIFGEYVYLRNPKGRLNKVFAVFSALLTYWIFTEFMYRNAPNFQIASLLIKIHVLAGGWTGPMFLHFCLVFTGKADFFKKRIYLILYYTPSALASVLYSLTNLAIQEPVFIQPFGWVYTIGIYYFIPIVWIAFASVYGAYLCLMVYLRSENIVKRKQALYIFIGISGVLVPGLPTAFFLPALGVTTPLIATAGFVWLAMFMGFAISRYELFVLNPATAADKIASTMTDSMVIIDPQGNVLIVNEATENMLGYIREELVGKNAGILFEDKELYVENFNSIFIKKKPVINEELSYLTKNNRTVPVLLSISPILSKTIKIAGAVFIAKDITDRKKIEESSAKERLRKVYIDVFFAITGEKLIIKTKDEMRKSLGEPVTEKMTISSFEDLFMARKFIKETVERSLPSIDNIEDVLLATQEAMTNAVKHAGNGYYQVFRKDNIAQFLIADEGPGIDFKSLPKATLLSGYSTKQTLGVGFNLMLELSDRIILAVGRHGTSVVLEFKESEVGSGVVRGSEFSVQG